MNYYSNHTVHLISSDNAEIIAKCLEKAFLIGKTSDSGYENDE
jgi:hypothetical protein